MRRWKWTLGQLSRKLWLRATLIGALGVVAALSAALAQHVLPDHWQIPGNIGADAVESLLTIIASSMLAATTFSLSTMVAAFGAATSNVTPRATTLLMEDRLTQNVLSSFIGSFLFAMVGIVVLKTGIYGPQGRVVLFIVTIFVIALIVVMLLRWINHLILLGRLGETTGRIEMAAAEALAARVAAPWLGGQRLTPEDCQPAAGALEVRAQRTGYLQHIDLPALQDCAVEAGGDIRILHNPGAFYYRDTLIAWAPAGDADLADRIRACFTVGVSRSFDQDPRFGLAVMAEVGTGALAPSKGDSGTAIDVVGRLTRLMTLWAEGTERNEAAPPEPSYPGLRAPALCDEDLFEDAFLLLARDGVAFVEVQLRLQKGFQALSRIGTAEFRAAARRQSELAFARAEAGLTFEGDRERLRRLAEQM